MIYRLDIRKVRETRFETTLTSDDGSIEVVGSVATKTMPTRRALVKWLASGGFEAYGDVKVTSSGNLRSMVRKVA